MQCPISGDYMKDPVKTTDGQTYERASIQVWFDRGNVTSPSTNALLGNLTLTDDSEMKNKIDKFNSLGENEEERLTRLKASCYILKDYIQEDETDSFILEKVEGSPIPSGMAIAKMGDGGLDGNLVVRMPYSDLNPAAGVGFSGQTLILADLRGEHSLFAMTGALFKPDEEQKLVEIIKSDFTPNNALFALRKTGWNKDEAMELLESTPVQKREAELGATAIARARARRELRLEEEKKAAAAAAAAAASELMRDRFEAGGHD